ncbi:hypothetical protein CEE37_01260 [candidate division LCP-89 bacterium B3_LCP]|uniref:Glycosyltransferase 2-like domain-containing protein n=1 Tax=candidate division LCP-89 bacterium B3_LCP TaxID=2012998 RepID=A0A532V576_UNCL8|nr:MAG: hypothetical protein CEE37_01260 [candidate division LCP-89 bacterium B3_LCP]
MDSLVVVIGIIYIFIGLIIWKGLAISPKKRGKETVDFASLILCARNEEKCLEACLESVEKLDADPDCFEVILVNDASDDATGSIMDQFAARCDYKVEVIHLSPLRRDEPGGKWRPLKEGVKAASGEVILITDADAILPVKWVEEHLTILHGSDISAGYAINLYGNVFNRILGLDWLFIQSAGGSLSNWGRPQSVLGKNLGFRRNAYEDVGGLEGIGFSLTEDQSLMRTVVDNGGKVQFSSSPDMAVSVCSTLGVGDYLEKKQRWATGFSLLRKEGKATVLAAQLRNIAIIIGLFTCLPIALSIWIITSFVNYLVLRRILTKLGDMIDIKLFMLWEIFNTLTSPLQIALHFASPKVEWKKRRLSNR